MLTWTENPSQFELTSGGGRFKIYQGVDRNLRVVYKLLDGGSPAGTFTREAQAKEHANNICKREGNFK